MFEGLFGLILYLAHWLSPEADRASLAVHFSGFTETRAVQFQTQMDIAWNRRLEQLVDAGIPLRFRILSFTDQSDTSLFYRTLYFDMVKFTYHYIDSSAGRVSRSEHFSLIHFALREFSRWEITVPQQATMARIEVHILPSRAEQLDRMVDMSRIWGQQKVIFQFDPREKLHRRSRQRRQQEQSERESER